MTITSGLSVCTLCEDTRDGEGGSVAIVIYITDRLNRRKFDDFCAAKKVIFDCNGEKYCVWV